MGGHQASEREECNCQEGLALRVILKSPDFVPWTTGSYPMLYVVPSSQRLLKGKAR